LENKVATYLGFALKSNKVIFGFDNLKVYNKKLYLIITCCSANEKYITFAKEKKLETKCDVYKTNNIILDDLIHKSNCKIIGVKSKDLATAITNNKADILIEVI
jgi:hypothetical protein